MHSLLNDLQKKRWVWTAAHTKQQQDRVASGFEPLDTALLGGFPRAGLIHIRSLLGCGELRLVLPCIANDTKKHLCVFIAPPYSLNAEFLLSEGLQLKNTIVVNINNEKEALWSAEQCAKSGVCRAVFIWQKHIQLAHAKKLELASTKGNCQTFFFQDNNRSISNLPVSLSLLLKPQDSGLFIHICKQKIGWPIPAFKITIPFKSKFGSPKRTVVHRKNIVAFTNSR